MRLYQKDKLLTANVKKTAGIWEGVKGLSGKSSLAQDEVLILSSCHLVDTFFMRFSIDVIFLNQRGSIIALYPNLKPLRMTWLHWKATQAIECASGTIERWQLKTGETLRIVS